jgi:hypothetical protein
MQAPTHVIGLKGLWTRRGRMHALATQQWLGIRRVVPHDCPQSDPQQSIAGLSGRPGELRHELVRVVWFLVPVWFLPVR